MVDIIRGAANLSDDQELAFGSDDDFKWVYDSTADQFELRDSDGDIVVTAQQNANIRYPDDRSVLFGSDGDFSVTMDSVFQNELKFTDENNIGEEITLVAGGPLEFSNKNLSMISNDIIRIGDMRGNHPALTWVNL